MKFVNKTSYFGIVD